MSEAALAEPGHEARGTEYAIVVNGELAVVPGEVVSYAEVVAIAYPVPPGPDTTYTVTYRKAKEPKVEQRVQPVTSHLNAAGFRCLTGCG